MKEKFSTLLSGFLSGFCITLGASAYLLFCSDNKFVGTILFALGLFTIIHFKLYLYTGKVGFLIENKFSKNFSLNLVIGLIGNILGVIATSYTLLMTRQGDALRNASQALVQIKANDSMLSIFILSFFCGVMIYLAVKGQQICQTAIGRVIFVFLPVSVFIICGFEHCVANCAYFVFSGTFSWNLFWKLILMIIGNGCGSLFFDEIIRLIARFTKKA